ncbi:MAG: hypothetical protein KIS78_07905 [Labilithrix sp.]|nr:hypothetical protein [Labilithrix sp.]
MTALRAWARADWDVVLDWGDVHDDLLDFIADESDYLLVSFAINFGRAHSLLARRVEELCAEFRAHDTETVRRWTGNDR